MLSGFTQKEMVEYPNSYCQVGFIIMSESVNAAFVIPQGTVHDAFVRTAHGVDGSLWDDKSGVD